MRNYIVVEYSKSQKAFHKQSLFTSVKQNQKNLLSGWNSDYLIVGVFNNHDEADDWLKKMYKKFEKIENAK